jgi:hypothetical protein
LRDQFAEYYPYDPLDLAEFVRTAKVVVDANVLLHLYRYSPDSADQLIKILEALAKRLWIPHQISLEFHRNRASVILEQIKAYDETLKALDSVKNEAGKLAEVRDRHPFIKRQELADAVLKPIATERAKVERLRAEHESHASGAAQMDPRWEKLTKIYEGRVGQPFGREALLQHYKDADLRFADSIPPGFKDVGKDGPRKYGDYLLWVQLLDHFEKEKSDVIFVTDDQKVDWWRVVSGRTLGAHPDLRREFAERTGQRIHFYSSDEFIRHFAESLKITLDQETRDEVERVSSGTSESPQRTGEYDFSALAKSQAEARERALAHARRVAMDPDARPYEIAGDSMEEIELDHAFSRLRYLRQEALNLDDRIRHSSPESPRREETNRALARTRLEILHAKDRLWELTQENFVHSPTNHRPLNPSLMRAILDEIGRDEV